MVAGQLDLLCRMALDGHRDRVHFKGQDKKHKHGLLCFSAEEVIAIKMLLLSLSRAEGEQVDH